MLFVRPFILRMQGRSDWRLRPMQVKADFDWPRPDKRREFHRARLEFDDAGVGRLSVHPSRSSGVLSSVTWANGLAVIPEGRVLRRGEDVALSTLQRAAGMIRILYFASLRERLGVPRRPCRDPATLAGLRAELAARGVSGARCLPTSSVCWRRSTRRWPPPDQPLQAGDEVGFFPPVTGG